MSQGYRNRKSHVLTNLLPLEAYAQRVFAEQKNQMPERTSDYWAKYCALLTGLREHVYPYINAGLACVSKSPGIYTDHGGDHFDEVVRYAGLLLGVKEDGHQDVGLSPFEVYLLLCAIRVHDAGNIDGRDDHEKRAIAILHQYGGNIAKDTAEVTLIANIAEAHGGITFSGSKDTIVELPAETPVAAVSCRPRQVAALVRFADEVCEHASRAARHHLNSGTLPEQNQLFHIYASSVTGAACSPKGTFQLRISVDAKYLVEQYPLPSGGSKFLIEEVFDRISKLDRERRYCNQYLDTRFHTRELDIRVSIYEKVQYSPTILVPAELKSLSFRIPSQDGYPSAEDSWRTSRPEWSGAKLAQSAKEGFK